MPRRQVVENECDRCERKWYDEYAEGDEPKPLLTLEVHRACVSVLFFQVLCEGCQRTIDNLLKSLAKTVKKSPQRSVAKEEPSDDDASSPTVEVVDGDATPPAPPEPPAPPV